MTSLAARLAYISRNVADLSRSVAFYCERLGFTPAGPAYIADPALIHWLGLPEQSVTARRLRYGLDEIELVEVGNNGRRYPAQANAADLVFQHFAMRCTDIEAACARLLQASGETAPPESITRYGSNPQRSAAVRLPPESGGVMAFKFRDPDGHPLELIEFPALAGKAHTLPEGIDHSAISVSNADRSIEFYTAQLGLSVGARQINQGPEQCRLDGLDAATVEVVALWPQATHGMHLELLGYHLDRTRPPRAVLPPVHEPADIASDRLVFETAALPLPSRGLTKRYHCITDPDGHFLVLSADAARHV